MFSRGKSTISLEEILSKATEMDLLRHYVGIVELPALINSPFRHDNNPSLGFGTKDNIHIMYHDFATKEKGGIIDYLMKLWGLNFRDTLSRIGKDLPHIHTTGIGIKNTYDRTIHKVESDLQVKVREWRDYDVDYWKSYGISVELLKYAEVYPISHAIITKAGHTYTFPCDKYAYVYVEHKEKTTFKIYQPFRDVANHKWTNKHDGSVISLWTKVPKTGKILCLCSSTKDALCLWQNCKIPSIAPQGEGYGISKSAIESLKSRYENIFILYDNDEAGIIDAEKLAEQTGFTNLVLPQFEGGKDISDLFHTLKDPEKFKEVILPLFKKAYYGNMEANKRF